MDNMSYDMDSLSTSKQFKETTYILQEYYIHRKMKPIYGKLVFKSFYKVITECTL